MSVPHPEVIKWELLKFCESNPNAGSMMLTDLVSELESRLSLPAGSLKEKSSDIIKMLQTDEKIMDTIASKLKSSKDGQSQPAKKPRLSHESSVSNSHSSVAAPAANKVAAAPSSSATETSTSSSVKLPNAQSNEDGDTFWELNGDNARATVRKYKGTVLVDLRKYYRKSDGTMAPTKKGISLTIDQWKALAGQMTSIQSSVKKFT